MLRLTLRSLQANGARLLLSSVAIILGVGFLAGSLIFTDGLKKTLIGPAVAQYDRLDVEVSPAGDWPADMVDRVRRVPGVRVAEGVATVEELGVVTGDGRRLTNQAVATSLPGDPALRTLDATRGRLPTARGEVVLDERLADRQKIRVGEDIHIGNDEVAARLYRVVGLVRAPRDPMATSEVFLGMMLADALDLGSARWSERVIVAAQPGVDNTELAARIRAAVPGHVRSHQQLVAAATNRAVGDARTFQQAGLALALIAVSVAAFVIANTFTIVLAQRTRETALLRLVGTTRRQVFRSLVGEALGVGVLGSVLGLLVGVGLAYGIGAATTLFGARVAPDLVITGTTVAVSLTVGIGVTVLCALSPAWRGTAVAPVAALSDAETHVARRPGRVRRTFGVLTAALGVAALLAAAAAGAVILVAVGAVVVFIGFVLLSPIVVPPAVRLLGWPAARIGGATGSLALANAVRNPRRIAATTNALVIGVTLVSAMTLMAASGRAPAERDADAKLGAHFLLTSGEGFSQLPLSLVDALHQQRELGTVYPTYQSFNDQFDLNSSHPALLRRAYPHPAGSVDALANGTAVVAKDAGIGVGGTLTVSNRSFHVVAVVPVDTKSQSSRPRVWLTVDDFRALATSSYLQEVQVDPAPGTPVAAARAALDRVARDYPTMLTYDRAEYVASLNQQVDRTMTMVTGLLALAVIIALIGVANTLTLSVFERTRENALLRAIGLTRRQLRGILAVEAVVMALSGTVLGIVAGLAIVASVLRTLGAEGTALPLVLPWDRLGVLLGVAVVAALAASVLPARRAARRPVVESLAAE